MLEVSVGYDEAELQRELEEIQRYRETLENEMGFALARIVDEVILPRVQARSISIWNIRTGRYSASWYVRVIGPQSIAIGNTTDYAEPLEYGWTTRGGVSVSSPGVLLPVLLESQVEIEEALRYWLEILSR